jgi:hypothetical protein
VEFLGPCWRVTLAVPALDTIDLVGDFAGGAGFDPPMYPGERIEVSIPSERIVVFPTVGPPPRRGIEP